MVAKSLSRAGKAAEALQCDQVALHLPLQDMSVDFALTMCSAFPDERGTWSRAGLANQS